MRTRISNLNLRLIVIVLTACAAFSSPASGKGGGAEAGGAAEKPSYVSAKADFDAGRYRPCLAKISQVLAMPDSKRDPQQRYNLFMLRGECLLQLKSPDLADDAFHAAGTAIKGGEEVKKIADAEGMVILIKAAPGMKYQPKDKTAAAIEIVPADSRKTAMLALLDDRMSTMQPKVDAALKSDVLTPSLELVPFISDMYLLEVAATGESKRTLTLGKSLGMHARELITPALARLTDRIQDLNNIANEPSSGGLGDHIGYRGLTSPERDELKGLADELVKIEQVAARARQMARRMGGTPEAWEAILADVADAKELAQKTYDRRY